MKRRTLIRQFGTAALATTTLVGTGAAERPTLAFDREIDVSNVRGTLPLSTVLDARDLDALPADVDPEAVRLTVPEDTDVIPMGKPCCDIFPLCCRDCPPSCDCCVCYQCDPDA